MHLRQIAKSVALAGALGAILGLGLHLVVAARVWSSPEHGRRAREALLKSQTLRECYGLRLLEFSRAAQEFSEAGRFDSPACLIEVTRPLALAIWNKGRTFAEATRLRTAIWVDLLASSSLNWQDVEAEACMLLEIENRQWLSRNSINNLVGTLAAGYQMAGSGDSWPDAQDPSAKERFRKLTTAVARDRRAGWKAASTNTRKSAQLFYRGDTTACERLTIPEWNSGAGQSFQCQFGAAVSTAAKD